MKTSAKRAYVRESLRVWVLNPEMGIGDLRARRPSFFDVVRAEIRRLGLEHERVYFCQRRRA